MVLYPFPFVEREIKPFECQVMTCNAFSDGESILSGSNPIFRFECFFFIEKL